MERKNVENVLSENMATLGHMMDDLANVQKVLVEKDALIKKLSENIRLLENRNDSDSQTELDLDPNVTA